MFRLSAKMAPAKDKTDRRSNKRKAENPETSAQSSSRKKGVGKGVSNIKRVYINSEKQETQAE